MPVEIRELIVKTTIGKAQDRKKEARAGSIQNAQDLAKMKAEIKRACMNELKEWLREQSNR